MLILPKLRETQFSNNPEKKICCKNVVIVSTYTTSLVEVLAFCTKVSTGLTMPLLLVCTVKEGRARGWNCGVVSASSCCMSDKVKGQRYEHGKIREKQEGKRQRQQLSRCASVCVERGSRHCCCHVGRKKCEKAVRARTL